MAAAYRETPASAPQPCEVVRPQDGRYVLREVGRLWPGYWLAAPHQVERRDDDPVTQRLLAKLSRAGVV